MADPIENHKSGLAKLHQSEEFSDCKLICGPYHFNLHKVILASQSDYFKAAFKQSTFKEGDSGVIELKTAPSDDETSGDGDDTYDEPEIVKLKVEFFYHFDYLRDTESSPDLSLCSPPASKLPSQVYIIEHAKVFAIAVKYQIDGLRDLAACKFKEAATSHWNHDDFAHSVHIAFTSTSEEVAQLREIVTNILHRHFDDLGNKAEVETFICNIPRLAYALLKRSRAGGKKGSTAEGSYECINCGNRFVGSPAGTGKVMKAKRYGKVARPTMYCEECF